MAEKIGARKDSSFKAVCTAPDFCRTPVGSSTPPLPYMIISDLSESMQTVPNVRFNGKPCSVLDQSFVPTCTGDEPGTAKGIRSGTVRGKTKPTSASSSVRAGGKNIVRERDTCTMNDGNTNGLFLIQPQPGCSVGADGRATKETNPGVLKPKPKEQGFLDKVKDQLSEAVNKPNEAFKGAVKGILNIPSELGELLLKSAAYDSALKTEESAAMLALFGDSKSAVQLSDVAAQQRAGTDAINVPKFKMSNPAQEGGDLVVTTIQLVTGVAGIIKGGITGAAKLSRKAGKTAVKDAAAIAKEEKALAGAANKGDGVKVLESVAQKKKNILSANKKRGKRREEEIKKELQDEGHEVLGSQVSVKTPETRRVVDHLIKDNSVGEIKAIEVKSGDAVRTASQVAKDNAMEKVGGEIIGKNAPGDLRGKTMKIKTEVRK